MRSRNFRRDLDDPEGIERYQAEALIHRHLPFHLLLGVVCHSEPVKTELERKTGLDDIRVRSDWYFR
ncbi:MAG: DarT ssDNA thymidine ADP-ribosyltransferase family protein [Vicinamibacteria bacterium]